MKLGADVEYAIVNEEECTLIDANEIVRFKEGVGFVGGIGHDGCSSIAEIRPRPCSSAKTVVERCGILLQQLDKKCKAYCEDSVLYGGAYHYDYGIGCHIHFGVSADLLRFSASQIHAAIAAPVRILFEGQNEIQKRIKAGYGKTTDNWNRDYSRPGRAPHCEYRVLPNFVVNKKIAEIVFDYSVNVLQYMNILFGCQYNLGNTNNLDLRNSIDYNRYKEEVCNMLNILYNKTHNKSIKNMLNLCKMAPVIPSFPDAVALWDSEITHIDMPVEKCMPSTNAKLYYFVGDECMEFFASNMIPNVPIKDYRDVIHIYGIKHERPHGIYCTEKVLETIINDIIFDDNGILVDNFSSVSEKGNAGIGIHMDDRVSISTEHRMKQVGIINNILNVYNKHRNKSNEVVF